MALIVHLINWTSLSGWIGQAVRGLFLDAKLYRFRTLSAGWLDMDCKKLNFFHHSIDVIDREWSTIDYVRGLAGGFDEAKLDDPFFVMDVGAVFRKHEEWCQQLPRVKPYYAVKCNNDVLLTTVLRYLDYGFDCASLQEIQSILSLGVAPRQIIYANPCKSPSHLREAAARNVRTMTFDNETEMLKIRDIYPDAELVLRIATPDSCSVVDLSKKFGCDAKSEAPELLRKAAEIGMKIVGVCFHVGSGCRNAISYDRSISDASELFEVGRQYGHQMQILDIGGGFPGHDDGALTFPAIAAVIRASLDEYFPPESCVQIIGEPGRFYAASAFTLCVNVIGRSAVSAMRITDKDSDADQTGYMYYLSDGIYGSFNSILTEGPNFIGEPILLRRPISDATHWSVVWGPTCDNADCVIKQIRLPRLEIGDWLVFENMGAYTITVSSEFNGFEKPRVHYMINEKDAVLLQNIMDADMRCRHA